MGGKFIIVDERGIQVVPTTYSEADAKNQIATNGKEGKWFAKAIEAPATEEVEDAGVPVPDEAISALMSDLNDDAKAEQKEAAAAAAPVAVAPAAPAPAPTPISPPSWFRVTHLPEDEEAEIVLPRAAQDKAPPFKVALLHSGGIGSTALLIDLLRRGCEVHPFYISMHPEAQDAKAHHMASKSVRKLRLTYGEQLMRLVKIDRHGPRNALPKLTTLINTLEPHISAEGFNAIALGAGVESLANDTEAGAIDGPLTESAIQVYTWNDAPLPDKTLSAVLEQFGAESTYRQLFWRATTSCRQPVDDRECGECERCVARASTFFSLWSEDRTLYAKKSTCAVEAFKRRFKRDDEVHLVDVDLAAQAPYTLKVTALRDDGTYEVQIIVKATGYIIAVGTFLRHELTS